MRPQSYADKLLNTIFVNTVALYGLPVPLFDNPPITSAVPPSILSDNGFKSRGLLFG